MVIDKGLFVNWHNIHDPSAVLYSLNNYFKGEKFHGFHRFMSNLKNLIMKILSCIAILYCVFAVRKIFITKMLKVMNPQKF